MNLTHIAKGGGRLSAVLKEELKMSTGLLNQAKWADGLRVNGQSRTFCELVQSSLGLLHDD